MSDLKTETEKTRDNWSEQQKTYASPVCRNCFRFIGISSRKNNGLTCIYYRIRDLDIALRLICGTRKSNRRECSDYIPKEEMMYGLELMSDKEKFSRKSGATGTLKKR